MIPLVNEQINTVRQIIHFYRIIGISLSGTLGLENSLTVISSPFSGPSISTASPPSTFAYKQQRFLLDRWDLRFISESPRGSSNSAASLGTLS